MTTTHTMGNEPPRLAGYLYPPHEARQARDAGQLLSIRIETSAVCNLKCRYCYNNSQAALPNELPYKRLSDVVMEASGLGAKSVVICGGGEPTIYPHFHELVERIAGLNMIPVVFTNAVAVDAEMARFLYNSGASVIGKLDSLDPLTQDYIVDTRGATEAMRDGIEQLLKAGYADGQRQDVLRLGLSCVLCNMNLGEAARIWRYCRDRRLYPNLETWTNNGRARRYPWNNPSQDDIHKVKLELHKLDHDEYGYDWLPYSPIIGSGCLQFLYSAYVTAQGFVRPCAGVHVEKRDATELARDVGVAVEPRLLNVNTATLREIIQSDLFQSFRHVQDNLRGRCRGCAHGDTCYGCRAIPFALGNSCYDEDPLCWHSTETCAICGDVKRK